MKVHVQFVLACLISLIWVQQILCDELSNTHDINNWTCICSSAYRGNQSHDMSTKCSTSCNCTPAGGGSNVGQWTCSCTGNGFPFVATDSHGGPCFTECNCTSGSPLNGVQGSKKHNSRKVVLITLLLCVVLTTFAFVSSILCYISRRDKCPIHSPIFWPEKELSYNSATNLISHKSSSVQDLEVHIGSPYPPLTGCTHKASFFFRSRIRTTHGVLVHFSYFELESATDKFSNSNLIGVGGSSHVYRGHLKNGKIVAIKRLKTQGGLDEDSVFQTEIELIARLHHCHVVPLLGYCSEFQGKHAERLLVFEYMPNGNLRDCLDAIGQCTDWNTRVTIALGAARGLEYLHEAAAPRILHRDVKSTNILLDENWRAKITDLGMAKRLRTDGIHSLTSSPARMQGTFGYFAPEYAIVGRASLKSDVFSFGVVLLELISGRQPIYRSENKGEESLVIWATPHLQDSRRIVSELPDPHLKGNFPKEEMQIMAYLAKECLLLDPESRPNMSEVVQVLSSIALEKSKRRNFPVNLFQSPSTRTMKIEQDMDRPGKEVEVHVDAEEHNLFSARCSLPLNIERNLCAATEAKEANNVSSEYIERLILLSSNGRSRHAHDDEAVDLTEPRFESFRVGSVRDP